MSSESLEVYAFTRARTDATEPLPARQADVDRAVYAIRRELRLMRAGLVTLAVISAALFVMVLRFM